MPAEQVTIGGEPVSGRVHEERAEPVPDDTASLSKFEGGDQEVGAGRDEDFDAENGVEHAP